MKRKALFLTSSVMAALVALPALAQPRGGQTNVIALQVNVDNHGQTVTYGVRPNAENVPLSVGQTIRVSLVGTAIVNGVGVERPINARFHVASGGGALELGQSGSNWVNVRARGYNGDGLAQLGYDVTDRNYVMRGGFESGRITIQLAGGPPPAGPVTGSDSRYQAAERITRSLYRAILHQDDLSSRRAQDDIDAIARGGYPEIQRTARNLATQAEANGNYNPRQSAEVLSRLYRELLHRQGDDRQMASTDSGFRDNVRLLRERGLVPVVGTIVDSEEFQRVQELDRYGLLRGDRGYERGHGDRDHDNRRPPI